MRSETNRASDIVLSRGKDARVPIFLSGGLCVKQISPLNHELGSYFWRDKL